MLASRDGTGDLVLEDVLFRENGRMFNTDGAQGGLLTLSL